MKSKETDQIDLVELAAEVYQVIRGQEGLTPKQIYAKRKDQFPGVSRAQILEALDELSK